MIVFPRPATVEAAGLIKVLDFDLSTFPVSDWLTSGGAVGNATATITGTGATTLGTDGSTGLVCAVSGGFKTLTFTLGDWIPTLAIPDRLVVMMETALVTGGDSTANAVELKFRTGAGTNEMGVHNRYNSGTKIRVRAPNESDTEYAVGAYQTWLGVDILGWSVRPFTGTSQPTPDGYTAICGAMNWGIYGPGATTQPMNRSTDKMVITFNTDGGSDFTAVLKRLIFYRCVGSAL